MISLERVGRVEREVRLGNEGLDAFDGGLTDSGYFDGKASRRAAWRSESTKINSRASAVPGFTITRMAPEAPSREVGDFLLARAALLKLADSTPIVQGFVAKGGEIDPSRGEPCWQRREGNIDGGGSIRSFKGGRLGNRRAERSGNGWNFYVGESS